DRVEHAAGHVLKGGLDRGRRFATVGLAILVPQLLNEDRLGGGAATIGSENDAEILGIHAEGVTCSWIIAISRGTLSRRSNTAASRSISVASHTSSRKGLSPCRTWLPRKLSGSRDTRTSRAGRAIPCSTSK